MSTSTNCGLMVGLFYEKLLDFGVEKERIDDLLDNEEVSSASYSYDSAPTENVIGYWLSSPSSTKEVYLDAVSKQVVALSKDFENMFGIKPKLYTTLFVY